MDINLGRVEIQLADGKLISVKPCKLKPMPLLKQQAARAINWAEYSQLESRVRSLECAGNTHRNCTLRLAGAKKEHRSASSKHAETCVDADLAKENIEACETSWCATAVLPQRPECRARSRSACCPPLPRFYTTHFTRVYSTLWGRE